MRRFGASILLSVLFSACGGGGGGALVGSNAGEGSPPAPQPPPGTITNQVMIELAEPGEIDEIALETGATVIGPVDGTPYFLVEIPAGSTIEEFVAELEDDARVVDGEGDVGTSGPEGGGSTLPAGGDLLPALIPTQAELLRIGLAEAHTRASGAGVRIAVLDTGVDASHPALAGRIEPGGWDFVDNDADPSEEQDGVDDDGDGLIDEGYGHGTFVSSLILAVAPGATILPVRVLGTDSIGHISALAEAITFAANSGVDAINLSVGAELSSNVVKRAIENAEDLGVRVIASAGNTGAQSVTFPGTLSDAFTVASVDAADVRTGFTSYGDDVDLSAPGEALLGAYPGGGIGTARWSGTSFSAALVSGGFALVREAFPLLSSKDVLKRIEDASFDIDALNPAVDDLLGKGRLDLDTATRP